MVLYPVAALCLVLATTVLDAFLFVTVTTPSGGLHNKTTVGTPAGPPEPTVSNTNPDYCAYHYREYTRLTQMVTQQPCMDSTNEDVWRDLYYLHREARYGRSCLEDLLITYKRVHEHHHCVCQGSFESQPEPLVHQACLGEASYKGFMDVFFDAHHTRLQCSTHMRCFMDVFFDAHHTRLQCSTHMRLWDALSHVVDSYDGFDCQGELVRTMYYHSGPRDPCHCYYVGPATTSAHTSTTSGTTSGSTVTTTATTTGSTSVTGTSATTTGSTSVTSTSATTTGSTGHSTGTTPSTSTYYNVCEKLDTIQDIASHHPVAHPNATACQPSGNHTSPDAFVLQRCNVTNTDSWRRGTNVRAHCGDVPQYTPVATFVHDQYPAHGGVAGIFISCLPAGGLKIAVQQCNHPPVIEHMMDGDIFTHDPTVYYTIQ